MDTLQTFISADLLMLDNFAANYSGDKVGNGQIPPRGGLCIPKHADSLDLVLTPEEFGYPIPGSLVLKGSLWGQDSVGRPLITWDIDQTMDTYLPGTDIKVKRISGQVIVALSQGDGKPDDQCGGANHPFVVHLDTHVTVPPTASNVVKVSLDLDEWYLVDGKFAVTIDSIIIKGKAAVDTSDLAVKILTSPGHGCGPPAAGSQTSFLAVPIGVSAGVGAAYSWEVSSGATPIGSTTSQKLVVAVSEPGVPFSVSVTLTFGVAEVKARVTIWPVPGWLAALFEAFCNFQKTMTIKIPGVGPDPGPESRVSPLSRGDLREILLASERLTEAARTAAELAGKS